VEVNIVVIEVFIIIRILSSLLENFNLLSWLQEQIVIEYLIIMELFVMIKQVNVTVIEVMVMVLVKVKGKLIISTLVL
jgi:hypothetical protein